MLHSSNPNTVYIPGIGRRSNNLYLYLLLDWLDSSRTTSTRVGLRQQTEDVLV